MKKGMKTVLAMLVLVVMGQVMTSCTKSTLAEDLELYEQASEGDDESVKEEPEG